ncbi:MAG TPA: hypothetical protein VHA52_05165 [Candidatus Babeliaceae bacterium]|nr:hypothetical protein [Candidatus Babeliaceae bacterium]
MIKKVVIVLVFILSSGELRTGVLDSVLNAFQESNTQNSVLEQLLDAIKDADIVTVRKIFRQNPQFTPAEKAMIRELYQKQSNHLKAQGWFTIQLVCGLSAILIDSKFLKAVCTCIMLGSGIKVWEKINQLGDKPHCKDITLEEGSNLAVIGYLLELKLS